KAILAVFACAAVSHAAVTKATYLFNNNLNAQEGGAPAMTAIDPGGANFYSTAVLYGGTRTIYNTVGTGGAGTNAGMVLDATGLVTPNSYSAEFVMSFHQNANAWRKIMDVSNRTADAGFYVDPNNHIDVFPVI